MDIFIYVVLALVGATGGLFYGNFKKRRDRQITRVRIQEDHDKNAVFSIWYENGNVRQEALNKNSPRYKKLYSMSDTAIRDRERAAIEARKKKNQKAKKKSKKK